MFRACISRRDGSRSLQGRTWDVRCARAPKPSTHHPPTPPSPPPRNLRHETEGSSGGLSDTMEKLKPRRNPWPAMSRHPPKPMNSTEPPSNYIQRLGINTKILGMRQVAAPNIEPSDLSMSESDRLRSKVRCFGSAFPGGTIAEASKVELGACAVLKPRSPLIPTPQRRHTLPQGICDKRRKARLGDCQIQWKS